MAVRIPVSGSDREMVVDDDVAEEAQRHRWRFVCGDRIIDDHGVVNFTLYGRKRARFVDGDPFYCVAGNVEGVGGNRTGRRGGRPSKSGVPGITWDKRNNRWKVEGGRNFKTLDEAVAWKLGGD